jgi:hypothetical protein
LENYFRVTRYNECGNNDKHDREDRMITKVPTSIVHGEKCIHFVGATIESLDPGTTPSGIAWWVPLASGSQWPTR